MKRILLLVTAALTLAIASCGGGSAKKELDLSQFPLLADSIRVRDPFILVDREEGMYYFAASNRSTFKAYKSPDLVHWQDMGVVFQPDADFWGKQDFWAPDMYEYKGKYYIFGTFTGLTERRGVSIMVADRPGGPYKALQNNPITPREWMCLDGALYLDDKGTPWMLYCRDWLEGPPTVGTIYAQQMTDDLTALTGDPIKLFQADSGPWVGTDSTAEFRGHVTDSPFIIDLENGKKTMIWSSFMKDRERQYAIGQLYSPSGSMFGPWEHDPQPLNDDDGGHAMVFTDLDGNLKMSYHSPNQSNCTLTIRDITMDKETGKITILPKK